jgi:hypothetical protein
MGNLAVCQNSVSRKTVYRNSDTNNTSGKPLYNITAIAKHLVENEIKTI